MRIRNVAWCFNFEGDTQIVWDFEGCSSMCFIVDACVGMELTEHLFEASGELGMLLCDLKCDSLLKCEPCKALSMKFDI